MKTIHYKVSITALLLFLFASFLASTTQAQSGMVQIEGVMQHRSTDIDGQWEHELFVSLHTDVEVMGYYYYIWDWDNNAWISPTGAYISPLVLEDGFWIDHLTQGEYAIIVIGYTDIGWTQWSEWYNFSVNQNPMYRSVTLAWNAMDGVAGYSIQMCQGEACNNFEEVARVSSDTLTRTIEGLAHTPYRFRVQAITGRISHSPTTKRTQGFVVCTTSACSTTGIVSG